MPGREMIVATGLKGITELNWFEGNNRTQPRDIVLPINLTNALMKTIKKTTPFKSK